LKAKFFKHYLMAHRAGFVSIVGRPNVGKSTLMNALVGQKLSVTNPKAQTTRHRILGIWNDADNQIVFSDTPGLLDPGYKLQENMMSVVEVAMKDADILLYLTEVSEPFNGQFIEILAETGIPVVVVLNKVDLNGQTEIGDRLKEWATRLPKAAVLPVSALHRFNTEELLKLIVERLGEHPPYYDKEQVTDRPVRFFVSEIIREKILQHFKKEVPYAVEVLVKDYREEPKLDRIDTTIFVERESQKMILIGEKGKAIKRLGTDARRDIENFIGKKVYLDL